MKAEDLKSWLCEATREKDPDTEAWDKVVSVMQLAFWDGYILEAMMWKTLVIIAKVDGGYKCMGLVEAIWKFCTSIINSRLRSSFFLHDALHGFRQGGGSGTVIMEAKMEQQLAGILHKPLF